MGRTDAGNVSLLTTYIAISLVLVGCGVCPPTPKLEATSPSGAYIARTYSFECGPIPPFNERLGLKLSTDSEYDEVAAILEAPYSASFNWTGDKRLQIIIDCQFTGAPDCLPASGRHITIQMRKRWRDVQLEYLVGPRLKSIGAGDILERFGSSYWF